MGFRRCRVFTRRTLFDAHFFSQKYNGKQLLSFSAVRHSPQSVDVCRFGRPPDAKCTQSIPRKRSDKVLQIRLKHNSTGKQNLIRSPLPIKKGKIAIYVKAAAVNR